MLCSPTYMYSVILRLWKPAGIQSAVGDSLVNNIMPPPAIRIVSQPPKHRRTQNFTMGGGVKHPTCSLADMIVDEQAILC